MVGTTVKVCQGPYKGYRGRVVDFKGSSVRIELESKVVAGMFTYLGTLFSLLFFFVFCFEHDIYFLLIFLVIFFEQLIVIIFLITRSFQLLIGNCSFPLVSSK